LWLVPLVGEVVVVGWADGDIDHPYVIGGLHNGIDAPPTLDTDTVEDSSGRIGVRAMVSREGHRLELLDAGPAQGLLLSTGDNSIELRMDASGSLVSLVCPGAITVTGNGITVDAGTGDLELKGGQVTITGQRGVEVSGPTVKVAGQGSAELSASGSVTVRGGMVRIN
jgi:uncharacterized protein involved in type VI secretion and phage assembly